jgi:hypothetical protein
MAAVSFDDIAGNSGRPRPPRPDNVEAHSRYALAWPRDAALGKKGVSRTPQGGPLSPLLSNLMLDVLDKELVRRGHRLVRCADDCNV